MYKNYTQAWPVPERYIQKLLRIMRLTTLILITAILQVSAKSSAQKISLSERNATLAKVFMKISEQSGYDFLVTGSTLKGVKPVTIEVKDADMKEVLAQILRDQPVTYTIEDKVVKIVRKTFPTYLGQPAEQDVRGKVLGEKGLPLAGATIRVKGSNKVATTGQDGYFVLNGIAEKATLIISFIGYQTQEVKAGENMEITLKPATSELQGVTINKGYYTERKELSTSSVVRIDAKEIEKQPVSNPLMALQGRVTGLDIMPSTGAPGGAVKLQIRGQNSIRVYGKNSAIDGNLPLYVINGVQVESTPIATSSYDQYASGMDPLSTINPSDIESIEILKDADATSLYGSRGANGVVLITTKKRRTQEKVSVNASIYRGAQQTTRQIDMLNREQYLEMRREALANDGHTTFPSWTYDLLVWDTTRYTNWYEYFYGKTSGIFNNELSIAGGNERTSFSVNGNYFKEGSILPGDVSFRRYTFSSNISHGGVDDRFKISASVNYGNTHNKTYNAEISNAYGSTLSPVAPALYNSDGTLNWALSPFGDATWRNPLTDPMRKQNIHTGTLRIDGTMSYELLKGLILQSSMGLMKTTNEEHLITPISSLNPYEIWYPRLGTAIFTNGSRNTWTIDPQLNYSRTFGNNHFKALVGTTWMESMTADEALRGDGYTSDASLSTLAAAKTISAITSSSKYRYNAVYGRLWFDHKEKYLLNITGRRDGSSAFGPNNRFGNFGAVGAGWIFSKEKWVQQHLPALSFGKIRASYGSTGNDKIGSSKFLKTYSLANVGDGKYGDVVALVPTGLYNPDFQWELTRKLETGIELGFFDNRINATVSWYRNRSSNQLVNYQLPDITGFSSVLTNFEALIENTGWELQLYTQNLRNSELTWNTSFNISFPRNKLVDFPGIENSSYNYYFKIGEPLSIGRRYLWQGLDPATGLHTFTDVNGDGYISSSDQVLTDPEITRYHGGINNDFGYRRFQLSFMLQFSNRVANTIWYGFPGFAQNFPVEVMQRWQKPGDITTIQKFSESGDAVNSQYQYVSSNGSFNTVRYMRLKTLSFSYSLPDELAAKVRMKYCRAFVQGHNLFTFTNFKGPDPETLGRLTPIRALSAGLDIRF